ncbi:MAG: ABC transporter substrate-binding protein [Eubacteriales bacterium]|nr:ABC transporter substrate-binding protein [Eubacteriales bacterium]
MNDKFARILTVVMAIVMIFSIATVASAEGKTLRLTQNVEMDTMDSGNTGDGYTTSIMSLLVDSLFRLDADSQPQSALAESYTVSDDGLTYTFTLRDSQWSNGDPVTAADFEYAWKRAINPVNGFEHTFMFNYLPIKNLTEINAGTADYTTLGVTAQDEKTLVVELTSPCNWLIRFLSDCAFSPLNQKFVESCGDQYALSSDSFLT